MSLLVIGSMAIDTVETPLGKNIEAVGGSATYASVSASYFTKVKVTSIIGEDFPKKHIKLLKSKGIDTSGIQIQKGKTFRWQGKYGLDLNSPQTIATHLNLLSEFNPTLTDADKQHNIILLANNDPDLQLKIISQADSKKFIAADTIEFWINSKRAKFLKVLKGIDVLIINNSEARLLTNESNLLKAAKSIIALGAKRVIIKKGEHGLMYLSGPRAGIGSNDFFTCPAYPLEVVYDPTGAGDTFAGGFLGFLANTPKLNKNVFRKALIYASVMASYNVEGFDLKVLSRLNKRLINKRYKEFEKVMKF